MLTAAADQATDSRPYIRLATPDAQYLQGESIEVLVHPPSAAQFEFRVVAIGQGEVVRELQSTNRLRLTKGLSPGQYELSARVAMPNDDAEPQWSEWSMRLPLQVHSADQVEHVQKLRQWEHRLSLIVDHDANGLGMMNDPLAFPPSYPIGENTHWFRSPVYEGSPTLLNEGPEFYRDPMAYFLQCVERLVDRNAGFITWHDLLDGKRADCKTSALIQFDMDGGPKSMMRLIDPLLEMGVRASIMLHRQSHDWYETRFEDLDVDALKRVEAAGWCIGYHNNALNNTQRLDRFGDYSSEVMSEAAQRFAQDVAFLKRFLDIRTYTSHGGNVLNHRLDPPPEAHVVCVDRTNTELWQLIRSMFSDGGFTARPHPLSRRVEALPEGIHFFRIHPVKYANFYEPWDFPPLVVDDAIQRGIVPTPELKAWIDNETTKQDRWLNHRRNHRVAGRFSHAGPDKPVSRRFKTTAEIESLITHHRSQRKAVFAREYPAADGDPRVFWWRMLSTYAPERGEILNVGALPHDRRKETTDFLSPQLKVVELDVDADREPDVLADITDPPDRLRRRFAGVFLMGLAYVHSPGKAIDACYDLVTDEGVGLFGFPDDMHPRRGAMWDPTHRPCWRRDLEPLRDVGLKGNLWSFDPDGLSDLFHTWQDVTIENFSQYWFVVCRRK